jgi:DNA-binding NarL/FixJ family response regulator
LLVAEDHAVMRMGLTSFLGSQPGICVVGEATSGTEVLEAARHRRPDVILVDVDLPDKGGVETCREIHAKYPEIRVLLLCSRTDRKSVLASTSAGAVGFTLKEDPPERLVEAVSRVATTGANADPTITPQEPKDAAGDALVILARHERSLLPLIAEGRTNREIAAHLRLSEHTVKTYVSHILRKLSLKRRAQLASFITRHSPVDSVPVWVDFRSRSVRPQEARDGRA